MILSIALAAIAGIAAGLALDEAASRLALEWYRDPEPGTPEDEAPPRAGETPSWLLRDGAMLRRAIVAVLTAGLFALLAAQYRDEWWHWPLAATYAALLLCCAETDIFSRRIPNVVVYPAILLALVAGMTVPGADRLQVLYGGLFAGGVFLAMALLPGGGLGDVKLGLFAGLALGFRLALPAVFIGVILGGVGAAAVLVASRFSAWRRPIPYGPYIALGALITILLAGTAFEEL